MKIIKIIIATMLLVQIANARYNPQLRKVSLIYTYSTYAVIKLEGNPTIETGKCGHNNHYAINMKKNKEMYSAILSAYISGKKVRLGYTPSVCANVWGKDSMVELYSVLMH